jgi:DNA-3-methyladenine glycosylase
MRGVDQHLELAGPPEVVAPLLLGAVVEHHSPEGLVAVRLTEVEAYAGEGEDPGSHAHRGETRRNAAMFGPPGRAYVYFTYGMHWCVNVVCGPPGRGGAVLLRAGEVVAGLQLARARRPAARTDVELAQGPARLAKALGVDGGLDGVDLLDPDGTLRLLPAPRSPREVVTGPRVGLSAAAARPWRFWLPGEATVSRYRPATRRTGG